jgi:hypothetical protein
LWTLATFMILFHRSMSCSFFQHDLSLCVLRFLIVEFCHYRLGLLSLYCLMAGRVLSACKVHFPPHSLYGLAIWV